MPASNWVRAWEVPAGLKVRLKCGCAGTMGSFTNPDYSQYRAVNVFEHCPTHQSRLSITYTTVRRDEEVDFDVFGYALVKAFGDA